MNYQEIKKNLVLELLKIANQKKDEISRYARDAQERANEAEGAMQSRYSTFKEEGQYLAGGLKVRLEELKSDIINIEYILQFNKFEQTQVINVLSITTVEFNDDSETTFFVFPALAGEKINNYTIITPSSPIGRVLINKKVDDEIEVAIGNIKRKGIILSIN